jgi:hypothetical protein
MQMSGTIDVDAPGNSGRRARACRTCAIAKAKCVPREGEIAGPCGRCHRLGKGCSGQTWSGRKFQRKHTRIEQLEWKVDSLLAARAWPSPGPPLPAVPPSAPSTNHRHPTQQILSNDVSMSYPGGAAVSADPLNIFRSELAKHCPWVVVPLDTTSDELRQTRPLLFLSICVAAAYRDPPRQAELGRKFRDHLVSQLLPTGEKSLDLLQGLLVAINWYQFHTLVSVHLTNLLHLAMAQVVELGLGRRLHALDRQRPAISGLKALLSDEDACRQNQPPSLDGPRAYLACFSFSAVISICIKKMDPMPWNGRMEECCRLLSERREYPSDVGLLRQIQLYRIAGRISQALPFDELECDAGASTQPIRMCIKSFHRDLQDFRKSSCDSMSDPAGSRSLLMEFYIVEMYLYEIGFQPSSKGDDDSLLRLDLLYSCLLSAKAFFEALFSVPPATFITSTYLSTPHLLHALAVLSKLSLLDDADWDLGHVRQTLDFAQVIDRVLVMIKEIEAELPQPRDSSRIDRLARIASQMEQLKERYFNRLATLERRGGASRSGAVDASTQAQTLAFDDEPFEALDESFWQDVIVDWNAFPEPGQ